MSGAPRIVVLSTLFPSPAQPMAGIFIRERLFRVGRHLPITVVAPRPWFPLQSLIRLFRPHFRPPAPAREEQQGVTVLRPRFLSLPGVLKHLDGLFMALGAWPTLRRLRKLGECELIDAHFAYPDGYAATLLGRWLDLPVTITLRGTEVPHSARPELRSRLLAALDRADRVFAVADALKRHVAHLGASPAKIRVVGNGVDTAKFNPMDRAEARRQLEMDPAAPVLVSVGGLVERKGFHRVIECLPALRERHPGLVFLVVGGGGSEGDYSATLHALVERLGLGDCVRFLGPVAPEQLRRPLSAADVFVLATRNEGWANVFLEAMACGLPVVTTDVGGNREVVCRDELGLVVPFGDPAALSEALDQALGRRWDRDAILRYAAENSWDSRVAVLLEEFQAVMARRASHAPRPALGAAGGSR